MTTLVNAEGLFQVLCSTVQSRWKKEAGLSASDNLLTPTVRATCSSPRATI